MERRSARLTYEWRGLEMTRSERTGVPDENVQGRCTDRAVIGLTRPTCRGIKLIAVHMS